jgi:WD40 repeat protein
MRTHRGKLVLLTLLALALSADAQTPPADSGPKKLDSLGDPLPEGAIARAGTNRLRQTGFVARLVFAPDGRTLASWHGGKGGTLSLWESNGREIRSATLPGFRLADLRLLPGGKGVAVLEANRGVYLWDLTGAPPPPPAKGARPVFPADPDDEHFSLFAISPDGKTLAGGSSGFKNRKRFVQLWRLEAGKGLQQLGRLRTLERNQGVLQWLAFSPDGRALVSAAQDPDTGDDVLTFWDTSDGKEMRRFVVPTCYRSDEGAAAALGPSGGILALGLQDGTVRLWEAVGKERKTLIGHERKRQLSRTVSSVAFSPDGKLLASGGWDGQVCLWDAATGELRRRWKADITGVQSVAFAPDGRSVAAGSQDGRIRLWDVSSGKEVGLPPRHDHGIRSLAISPDGRTLATTDGGDEVFLWDARTGKSLGQRPTVDGWTTLIGYAGAGKQLLCATGGKDLRVWEPVANRTVAVLPGTDIGVLSLAAATADGRLLVTYGSDRTARLWRLEDGAAKVVFTLPDRITFVGGFSADGKRLSAVDQNRLGILLWETGEVRPPRLLNTAGGITAVAFAPDGEHVASGGEAVAASGGPVVDAEKNAARGALNVWELASGKLARSFPVELSKPDRRQVRCLSFSPDGRTLATGEGNGLVSLYEVASGKLRRHLHGHADSVVALGFSADGARLVSGSLDTTALVWDLGGRTDGAAPTAAELEALWADLAGADAAQAHRAIRRLAGAAGSAVPFLHKRLRPAGPPVAPGRLEKLLEDLGGDRFAVRAKADAELAGLGELAVPALRKALAAEPPLEKRRRIEKLLTKLERPWERFLAPEQLRLVRAVEALELVGSPAAREVLTALAKGARAARLTQEARAALVRLARRPPASP